MKNYYFTFGSNPQYPYGREEYVKVSAPDVRTAVHIFQKHHPNRPGSNLVNCAFWYGEEEFLPMIDKYYDGAKPVEELTA